MRSTPRSTAARRSRRCTSARAPTPRSPRSSARVAAAGVPHVGRSRRACSRRSAPRARRSRCSRSRRMPASRTAAALGRDGLVVVARRRRRSRQPRHDRAQRGGGRRGRQSSSGRDRSTPQSQGRAGVGRCDLRGAGGGRWPKGGCGGGARRARRARSAAAGRHRGTGTPHTDVDFTPSDRGRASATRPTGSMPALDARLDGTCTIPWPGRRSRSTWRWPPPCSASRRRGSARGRSADEPRDADA